MAYSRRSCLLCQPTGTSAIACIMWIGYDPAIPQNFWDGCSMDMGCIHYLGPELVQIALTWLPTVYPHHNFVSVPPIDTDLMYTSWSLFPDSMWYNLGKIPQMVKPKWNQKNLGI